MQGLGTSCPTSMGRGQWFAHSYPDGSFFLGNFLEGSLANGEVARNCGGGVMRMLDANTMQDQQGGRSQRVQ